MSAYDLTSWVGFPAIYVFDCPSAGTLIPHFKQIIQSYWPKNTAPPQQQQGNTPPRGNNNNNAASSSNNSSNSNSSRGNNNNSGAAGSAAGAAGGSRDVADDCILLGACSAGENLPSHPKLPADLLTACLTTPIRTALHWFVARNNNVELADPEIIDNMPVSE